MEIQNCKNCCIPLPWWPSWNYSYSTPPEPYVGLSWNLMGGIKGTLRFRIAKIVPFVCPRWWPSWKSPNHICSRTLSLIEPKLCGRHLGNMEIQNCLNRSILPRWQPSWNSSNHISSQTISWIEPKLDGRYWGDLENQNCSNCSVPISKIVAILKIF